MVKSCPRKTRKETDEKTTANTMRAWTAWSHSVSFEEAHSQVSVPLSYMQLYQRSEFFVLSQTHHDFSMVAMKSIARVMRWSRVTNIRRNAMVSKSHKAPPAGPPQSMFPLLKRKNNRTLHNSLSLIHI